MLASILYLKIPGRLRIDPVERRIMRYFLCVLGMVMIIEGLPYFAWPDKMKVWLVKISQMPDGDLRKIGTVLMVLGLLVIYLARP